MHISNNAAHQTVAIIGGSSLYDLNAIFGPAEQLEVATAFSDVPVLVSVYTHQQQQVLFLPRHGQQHGIAPHLINYRANLWALQNAGAKAVIAINTVGGISDYMSTGTLCLPDQLIDYTWGRAATFCERPGDYIPHLDFTEPFDQPLRSSIATIAERHQIALINTGVYACTQGPRLETAAEIRRLAADGCDIVGMTAMPEAILARELGLPYAVLALVVNRAAGLDGQALDFTAIKQVADTGIKQILELLRFKLTSD